MRMHHGQFLLLEFAGRPAREKTEVEWFDAREAYRRCCWR
jgi:hypothetical protein